MTISFPYRHPDNSCCSLHLHHDLAVHPPQFLQQLPMRASVHEFATERNNSIEQPGRNTHPRRRRPRIRRSRHASSPIFAAASRPISSEIESPPKFRRLRRRNKRPISFRRGGSARVQWGSPRRGVSSDASATAGARSSAGAHAGP
jgi:hypothetical protein